MIKPREKCQSSCAYERRCTHTNTHTLAIYSGEILSISVLWWIISKVSWSVLCFSTKKWVRLPPFFLSYLERIIEKHLEAHGFHLDPTHISKIADNAEPTTSVFCMENNTTDVCNKGCHSSAICSRTRNVFLAIIVKPIFAQLFVIPGPVWGFLSTPPSQLFRECSCLIDLCFVYNWASKSEIWVCLRLIVCLISST